VANFSIVVLVLGKAGFSLSELCWIVVFGLYRTSSDLTVFQNMKLGFKILSHFVYICVH